MPSVITPEQLEERVVAAVDELLRRDGYLLEKDANERTITHCLAVYLAPLFREWHVDSEYNRDGDVPKRLSAGMARTDDVDARTVFPDVIIHRRGGNDDNLAVIEAKKTTHPEPDRESDRSKLQAFREDARLHYPNSVLVVFETRPRCAPCVDLEFHFADGTTLSRHRP